MKPVPFAQYLARQQEASSSSETRPAQPWPPRAKPEAVRAEPPRRSLLLRPVEKERPEPKAETARRIEQAHLKAFEEGRAAARADFEEERARLREALQDEIARAREQWAQDEAARLAEAHRAAIADFETRCAQAVAHILRPFLVQQAIARVTQSLVETLEALLASHGGLFEISGPPDLLAAIEARFGAEEGRMAFKPGADIDIRIRIDDTVVETQLEPWLRALEVSPDGERD
jgi:hypothetical protein